MDAQPNDKTNLKAFRCLSFYCLCSEMILVGDVAISKLARAGKITVAKRVFRGFQTTNVLQQPRSLIRLRKLQADYQCEDGKPIWLKGGFCDRILYSSTIIGCFLGFVMTVSLIYDNAKPASWKTPTC